MGTPTVVVSHLDVKFTVYGGGRRGAPSEQDRERTFLQRTRDQPKPKVREIHAVKDVSFVARHGESIGIIGRNGSGKSTLLRAVAGLLPPSAGRVWVSGEPSLLGVNAVLMNKLSGERNIYIGAQALGLSKAEIAERFDDIVEFAGIGEAVYLPMSTYSSGMSARLRFAISTAAAPDVLMIDEALATGDADFRAKSAQRIAEVREQAGTVFLVSHSNASIRRICDRVLWMDQGRLLHDGPTEDVLALYEGSAARSPANATRQGKPSTADPPVEGVDRWSGEDRCATAIAVSEHAHAPGVPGVLVANDAEPLAVAAAVAVLAPLGWPLLLTKRGVLPDETLDELRRLEAPQVALLGNDTLIAPEVVSQLKAALPHITVHRCPKTGPAAVLRRLQQFVDLPSGDTLLVGSSAQRRRLIPFGLRAAALRAPLLVVAQDALDEDSRALLSDISPQQLMVLGGADTVAAEVVQDLELLTGVTAQIVEIPSPQEGLASVSLSNAQEPGGTTLVTTGGVGGETLVAFSAAATLETPLVAVVGKAIPASTQEALRTLAPDQIIAVGSPEIVSPALRAALSHYVS